MSHHLINLDFYKTGDGTKQNWGHEECSWLGLHKGVYREGKIFFSLSFAQPSFPPPPPPLSLSLSLSFSLLLFASQLFPFCLFLQRGRYPAELLFFFIIYRFLFQSLGTEFQNVCPAALCNAVTKHVQEAEAAKNSGNPHWYCIS